MTLSAAEVRSLRICEEILARRNPELLKKLNAEFEAMSDVELAGIARLAPSESISQQPPAEPLIETQLQLGTPSDELWLKWCELDRLIGEADERAHREAGASGDLYNARSDELLAPILKRLGEVEERIAGMVPMTIRGLFDSVSPAERSLDS
jgi:hypothetical protein